MSENTSPENISIIELRINNEHGLHARPAAELVKIIKSFDNEITVANLDGTGKEVNGRSMMKVVSLGVKKGHRLRFSVKGDNAQQAIDGITSGVNAGLGE